MARDPRELERAYYAKNRDKINARRAAARLDPVAGAKLREKEKARYWDDPGKARRRAKEWATANPELVKSHAKDKAKAKERRARFQKTEKRKQWYRRWKVANREKLRLQEGARRLANRERFKKNKREWRKKNPDKVRADNAKRRAANPEKSRQASRNWFIKTMKTDPERIRNYHRVGSQKRRARKASAGGSFTAGEIKELFERQGKKCATCKTKITMESGLHKFHIDHVMPLAKEGSTNTIDNIQLLCRMCNSRKSKKHPDDWAKENGLLFC